MRFLQGLRAISPTLNTRFGARQLLAELVQSTGNRSSSINDRLGAVVEGLGNQSSLLNDKLGAVIEGLDNQSSLLNERLGAVVEGLSNQSGLINDRLGAVIEGLDNQSSLVNEKLGAVIEGLDNQSSLINEKLGALIEGLRNQSGLINDKLSALIDSQVAQLAVQRAQTEIIDRMMQSVGVDVRRLADLAEIQARQVALQNRPKIYICHSGHEDDLTYTENVTEYLQGRGIECKILELNSSGQRPELQQCLDDQPVAVLGFNSQLDNSWLPTGSFLEAAASRKVPVIQWILDHPSARWPEFNTSTPINSRFLLNTKFGQQYFHQFCMPDALTDTIGGVGPSRRSRIDGLSRDSFMSRPIKCLIPISLKRYGRTIADTQAAIAALDSPLAAAVREAHASAMFDLMQPLKVHLIAALERIHQAIPARTFNFCFQLFEDLVQVSRRLKIFEVVRNYPVLIQSDESATAYFQGAVATFAANVGMQSSMTRMQSSRSVLSVSPLNDLIHDRTMNGLNAGCVNISEDNLAHRAVFQHGKNALLFRYEDDSLPECLDIVCNQPERAYSIAMSGMALRDAVPFVNCSFHAILDLARR